MVLVQEHEDWHQLVFFQWHHQIRFGRPLALHQAGNGGISTWLLYHLWATVHFPLLGPHFLGLLFNHAILVGFTFMIPYVVSLGDQLLEARMVEKEAFLLASLPRMIWFNGWDVGLNWSHLRSSCSWMRAGGKAMALAPLQLMVI